MRESNFPHRPTAGSNVARRGGAKRLQKNGPCRRAYTLGGVMRRSPVTRKQVLAVGGSAEVAI